MWILNKLLSYFKRPIRPLFREGDRITLKRGKIALLGGIEDETTQQVLIKMGYILTYYKESKDRYYFVVHFSDYKTNDIKNGDVVSFSKTAFEALKYDRL